MVLNKLHGCHAALEGTELDGDIVVVHMLCSSNTNVPPPHDQNTATSAHCREFIIAYELRLEGREKDPAWEGSYFRFLDTHHI
jgi:hypothetical protein